MLANGGTIFLDEIENTTPNLQAKLLRVLETGDVRPVGGTQVRHVDVRVVAASNRDLGEEVRAGRFRADLFYRLNSFTIDIPPLRERPEDIPELARAFVEQFNRTLKRSATGVAPDADEVLHGYGWPGNVRELRNVVERAVLLSRPGEMLTRRLLPPALLNNTVPRADPTGDGSLRARLQQVERNRSRGPGRRAAAGPAVTGCGRRSSPPRALQCARIHWRMGCHTRTRASRARNRSAWPKSSARSPSGRLRTMRWVTSVLPSRRVEYSP